MNKISLDFAMASSDSEDLILRAIAKEALDFLLNNVDFNRIRCILLTGSVANGEGTVIRCSSSMITSDFDFIIYMDLPYFVRNRTRLLDLSRKISAKFLEKNMQTHILFLPSTQFLPLSIFRIPAIYEYEFASASKCVFGKVPRFSKSKRPSKKDALELVFTVVSDLVFLQLRNISKVEETYVYAKRALTLLNSILIFQGLFAETYQKRMDIAKKYTSKTAIPINRDEIKTLEIFTEYKLSGSFRHLLDSFACKKTGNFIRFQREFLEKLTRKILYYELSNILNSTTQTNPTHNDSFQNMTFKFSELLRKYSKCSRTRLPSRIMGTALFLFYSLARNKKRKELFATFIFHKQPPKTILNVLITLLFMYGQDVSVARMLKEIFPWIDLNDASAIQKMFSLWQIAEQSIKLS